MLPVVISGGVGTRLWPLSRATFPKQFLELNGETLFGQTLRRVKKFGSPWVVTTSSLRTLTNREMLQNGLSEDHVLYEPFGKNTAPAIAFLCKSFLLKGLQDEVVGVFPADHYIKNEKVFMAAVRLAEQVAQTGKVVTLGIRPTEPATGYGYIEVNYEALAKSGELFAFPVKCFYEKPNVAVAERFLKQGNFYWNAGMFVFKVKHMIELLKTHMSELWAEMDQYDASPQKLISIYEQVKNTSIDYGVMEKLGEERACVPCDIDWSDLGSWDAIAEVGQMGPQGHVTQCEAKNNFVEAQPDKTYSFVGVDDLIVVDTQDALLITKKGQSQSVKAAYEQLVQAKNPVAVEHVFDHRPWGSYRILTSTPEYKVKSIVVAPFAQISYQSHERRAEHWVVVRGKGEVVLNGVVHPVGPGEHIYVPAKAKHRMRNVTDQELVFIEVQLGEYFGEDDIKRYEDDYNRAEPLSDAKIPR